MKKEFLKVGLRTFAVTLGLLFARAPRAYAADMNLNQCEYKKFRVTSYYSPVPNQDFYNRPDYRSEVILNGKGTHGASGRAVFNGMIAAPKDYKFGTKIYFPGRGIGQVHDRGQAIVNKGERNQVYDRIDIRAGKGEDGLRRALSFGVQYLDGYVCPSRAIPQKVGFDYSQFPQYDNFFERMLWVLSLSEGRDDPFVQAMQRYLAKLGYFDPDLTTGKFGKVTKASVCAFQQRYIGLTADHPSCGVFGPQTRKALYTLVKQKGITLVPMVELQKRYASYQTKRAAKKVDRTRIVGSTPNWVFHNDLFTTGEFANYTFTQPFSYGQQTKELRILQRKLAWLGYYEKEEITGVYDTYTIQALYRLQVDKGLLSGNEDQSLRGYFGPGTRAVVNTL